MVEDYSEFIQNLYSASESPDIQRYSVKIHDWNTHVEFRHIYK